MGRFGKMVDRSYETLLAHISRIYDAATDPAAMDGIATLIQSAMDIESTLVFLSNHQSGDLVKILGTSANFDSKSRAIYGLHYHERNPWYQAAKNKKGLFVMLGDELIPRAEFERSEFRADWCTRVGIYHFLGGTAPVREGLAVAIGMHRPEGGTGFDLEDKRYFSILLEHVVRACEIADRIGTFASRETQTLELLSSLSVGLILVDGAGKTLHVNSVAERLLRSNRWLTSTHGRVRPVHPAHQAEFERLIGLAALASAGVALGKGGLVSLRDPVEPPLAVNLIPYRSKTLGLGEGRPTVALVFSDPDTTAPDTEAQIAATFGLTPAESRLVSQLMKGGSLVEAAACLKVSVNTAKSQLQSVFLKTGSNRQSELLALIAKRPTVGLRCHD